LPAGTTKQLGWDLLDSDCGSVNVSEMHTPSLKFLVFLWDPVPPMEVFVGHDETTLAVAMVPTGTNVRYPNGLV
jgi:hypothetical protein